MTASSTRIPHYREIGRGNQTVAATRPQRRCTPGLGCLRFRGSRRVSERADVLRRRRMRLKLGSRRQIRIRAVGFRQPVQRPPGRPPAAGGQVRVQPGRRRPFMESPERPARRSAVGPSQPPAVNLPWLALPAHQAPRGEVYCPCPVRRPNRAKSSRKRRTTDSNGRGESRGDRRCADESPYPGRCPGWSWVCSHALSVASRRVAPRRRRNQPRGSVPHDLRSPSSIPRHRTSSTGAGSRSRGNCSRTAST